MWNVEISHHHKKWKCMMWWCESNAHEKINHKIILKSKKYSNNNNKKKNILLKQLCCDHFFHHFNMRFQFPHKFICAHFCCSVINKQKCTPQKGEERGGRGQKRGIGHRKTLPHLREKREILPLAWIPLRINGKCLL